MPTEASIVELGQVAQVRSGYAFKSSEWSSSGIPVVKIANVKSGRLEMAGCSFIPSDIAKEAGDFNLSAGDILIAMTGYIGDVARVLDTDLPVVLNQRVGKFILKDKTRLNDDYLFQFLRWSETRRAIEALGYGSAQPNVSPSLIHGIEIPLPAIEEQREIASILGALDDKIELNRRMNGTLEALAQAVFKEWFVERRPGGGEEKAEEGWEEKTIGDLAEVVGGATPSTKHEVFWSEHGHAWATPKDLSSLQTPVLLDTERHLTAEGLAEIGSGLLPIGTVLMSSRAPIGYIAVAEVPTAVNQGFIAMKAKLGISNLFLWQWTKHNMDEIKSRANGSTFQEISKASFRPIAVAVPPPDKMKAYDALVRPMYERLVANERESRTLTALRDTLLPKLMRGEVRVSLELKTD